MTVPLVLHFEERGGPRLETYRGCQQSRGFLARERWRFEGTLVFVGFSILWAFCSVFLVSKMNAHRSFLASLLEGILLLLGVGLLVQSWAAVSFSTELHCDGDRLRVSHGPFWKTEFAISKLPRLRAKPLRNHWLYQWRGGTSEWSRNSWGVVFVVDGKERVLARALSRESALFVTALLNEPS